MSAREKTGQAMILATLDVLLYGRVQPLGADGMVSAIAKMPTRDAVAVGREGIEGDEQANRKHHGGREKALHHYPWEHYAGWRLKLSDNSVLDQPGAFGENFSTSGMTEKTLCIGDVLRVGTVLVQVSQGRQPCRTLNERFQYPKMARDVQSTGHSGWYYRVLETGHVRQGDVFTLEERPHPTWSIDRVQAIIDQRVLDTETLETLSTLRHLSPSWQHLFKQRLLKGAVEDWRSRLGD